MTECPRETCYAPEMPCVLGFETCPHFSVSGEPASELRGRDGHGLPWSGLAVGSADLVAIAAVGRMRLVALVGGAGAGKTTALAAHWLAARRGQGRYGSRFAGSYTLLGWHQIARHLQWQPWGRGFPPHTSATSERVPALLHVAYLVNSAPAQIVFADVPGEWYRAWAYDADAVEGASWIANHADAFVILADTEALSGVDRGTARGDYEALASRLSTTTHGRPVIPVRTKADLEISDAVRSRIEEVNRERFTAETVSVSVYEDPDRAGLTEVVDLAVDAALAFRPPRGAARSDSDVAGGDPLLRYGDWKRSA